MVEVNKFGCLAPQGCKLLGDEALPQVAVGGESSGPYEAAFSVKSGELEEFLFDCMRHSWTLKAWFAYKIRERDLKENDLEARSPTWQRIWDLIQRDGQAWEARYDMRKEHRVHTISWELGEPRSILELFARALAVLAFKVNAGSKHEDSDVRGLKWHDYYYEDEGKFFMIYQFMLFQQRLFRIGRINSIHPPVHEGRLGSWHKTYGYKIRHASEKFMENTGWDPLDMLSTSLRDKSTRKQPTTDESTVTFIHTQDRKMRVYKKSMSSIRDQAGTKLRRALQNLLDIEAKEIYGTGHKNDPIKTCSELLKFASSSDDAAVWLCNDSEHSGTHGKTPVEKHPQQDYSNHAVLKLEPHVEYADNKEHVLRAKARLSLIRGNHRHSADFVEELKEFFGPLEKSIKVQWQTLLDRKHLCEDAIRDPTKFHQLRQFVTELPDAQKAHAEQYFALVNTDNPLAGAAAVELSKLLVPPNLEWLALSELNSIFGDVRRAV